MKPLCLCLFVLVSASIACGQSSTQTEKVLTKVADIPMPGPAVRFDYQAFDPSSGRLYIAHMNADQLVVEPFSAVSAPNRKRICSEATAFA